MTTRASGVAEPRRLPHEAFHASVFVAEAEAVHQVLPDGRGVSAFGQFGFDELEVRSQTLADEVVSALCASSVGPTFCSESVDTPMAGFGCPRPQPPGGRTGTPAAF